MENKNKAVEAIEQDQRWVGSKYYQTAEKAYREHMEGQESKQTTPTITREIYDQIVMGKEKHLTLDWVKRYQTNKNQFVIPLGTYAEATVMAGDSFVNAPKTVLFVSGALDYEYGVEVTWDRKHREDATWDVLSEQHEGAGYAIKAKQVGICVDAAKGIANASLAGGNSIALSASLAYKTFKDMLSAIDEGGYGPADYVIVKPKQYWQLLNDDKFINTLYAGDDETMRSGTLKTTLGVTVQKCDQITGSYCYAFNSKKAMALVERRDLTVEPFEYPDKNKYGFIAAVRCQEVVKHKKAISKGKIS